MDVIKSLSSEKVRNLNLICKWGCDGTSGQNTYKQKFTNDDGSKSDANIFFHFNRSTAAYINQPRNKRYTYCMENYGKLLYGIIVN